MKKLIAILFAGAISMAGFAFNGATAAEDDCLSNNGVDAGIADACGGADENGGHGKIDGNDDNDGPHAGYISGGNDGYYEQDSGEGDPVICISDEGDPEPEEDPETGKDANEDDNGSCNEEIPEGVVTFVTDQI